MATAGDNTRATNVGIIELEVYFPAQYVDQSELEEHDGVSKGKYTVGLGQRRMGFCSDREDINSLCLTVLSNLMKRSNIDYSDIGRLEIGTETVIDKSKSVKSVLMQLFENSGNYDVEGVDTTNACYGGTSALINAVNWIESSSWDGRYAVVIAGDIAVYATGNARPTGGAGAVAMLIGPNAPLVIESGLRGSYMRHVYDFYKPDMSSEYPTVDGKLSIQCYLSALDACYETYGRKLKSFSTVNSSVLDQMDFMVFHSPYCKLVQKSLARLVFNDFLNTSKECLESKYSSLLQHKEKTLKNTYFDKNIEKDFMQFSLPMFQEKTQDSLLIAREVGNMYTPSVYGGLISVLATKPVDALVGKRIGMFSYGSGLASTLYSIRISDDTNLLESVHNVITSVANLKERLDARVKMTPEKFTSTLKIREEMHHLAPYTPAGSIEEFLPGTWYLVYIDDMHRRTYDIVPSQDFQGCSGNLVSADETNALLNGAPL